jgi:hypothetical protein
MGELLSSRASSLSLWLGIYAFPWRLSNIQVWINLSICMILLALWSCGFAGVAWLMSSDEGQFVGMNLILWRAIGYVFISLCVLTFLTCLYPAACFMTAVEDTANGNDDVAWPDLAWYEFLRSLIFLMWIFGCCLVIAALVLLPIALMLSLPAALWWAGVVALAVLLFPIPLLSAMIAGMPWILIHPTLLVRLVTRPLAGLSLYVHTSVLMLPCLGLGFWMLWGPQWWLIPIVGLVWSTSFLCYVRALGQVGWVLVADERKKKKLKKKKRIHE